MTITVEELYETVLKQCIDNRGREVAGYFLEAEEEYAKEHPWAFDPRWLAILAYAAGRDDGIRRERARKAARSEVVA